MLGGWNLYGEDGSMCSFYSAPRTSLAHCAADPAGGAESSRSDSSEIRAGGVPSTGPSWRERGVGGACLRCFARLDACLRCLGFLIRLPTQHP